MVRFYTYLEVYLDDLHKRVSLSEFEKHFKKPHQTAKAHLQEFVKEKILTLEKKERFSFYSLNKRNPLLREYLALCEKERLLDHLEKNTLFRRLYEILSAHFNKNKVLLFGSATWKKEFADIDLLIISNDKEIKKAIDEFIKTYSVKIHVVQTDKEHLTESFIMEIKKQHVIYNEHDYFIKELYKHEL